MHLSTRLISDEAMIYWEKDRMDREGLGKSSEFGFAIIFRAMLLPFFRFFRPSRRDADGRIGTGTSVPVARSMLRHLTKEALWIPFWSCNI